MIRSYLKIAWRNLARNKSFSIINITGLSVGIACCIVIFLYLQNELSWDSYHTNAAKIYRLEELLHLPKETRPQAVTSPPMAHALQNNFPDIQKTVRLSFSGRTISFGEKKFYDTRILYADSTMFDIFSYHFINGDPHTALLEPRTAVITASTAKKYFGDLPAIGKTMLFSDSIPIRITGVMEDVPANSHFNFDVCITRTLISELFNHQPEQNWFDNNYYTYFLLPEKYNYHPLETKMSRFIQKEMAEEKKTSGLFYELKLTPLTSIHLHSNSGSEINPNSDIKYVYIFSAAAILILLIACSNFINLTTAKSLSRVKEIGLRKVIGAKRSQLIFQFLGESFLFTVMSAIISFLLVTLALPYFNTLTGRNLSINFFSNLPLLLIYFSIVLIVGLVAGAYPALSMSAFIPSRALKGTIKHSAKDILFRQGLVVTQFTIAIVLVAGTILVLQQLRFIYNKNLGLSRDQVLELRIRSGDLAKGKTILDELQKLPGVTNAGFTDFSFKGGISNVTVLPEGATESEITSQAVISVDENFINTFKISLLAGRNFSSTYSTDTAQAFMVNEMAVRVFGWKSPAEALGKKVDWGLGKKGKVIGVVKDFNFKSLHEDIRPIIIHILPDWYKYVAVRIKTDHTEQTIHDLEATWKKLTAYSPFTYTFLSQDFEQMYKDEKGMQSVLNLFTLLSVFVACLGLFGLATYSTRQRIKEIGIRKVLGASIPNIVGLLSKDFLGLVLIAIVIASPIAWWSANKWLDDFAYRINIQPWVFVVTGIISLLIAFITVSFQTVKAGMRNPVKSLRSAE